MSNKTAAFKLECRIMNSGGFKSFCGGRIKAVIFSFVFGNYNTKIKVTFL